MKQVVSLLLLVATATAISDPVKLLKHKVRQAHARKVGGENIALKGLANGGSKSYARARDQVDSEGATSHTFEKRGEIPEATWTRSINCTRNAFAKGMGVWQDPKGFLNLDGKGVTKVKFRCTGHPNRRYIYSHSIDSGVEKGTEVPVVNCNVRSRITGVTVIYGGPSLGIVQLIPMCQIPNYDGNEANRPGHYHNVTIDAYNWDIQKPEDWIADDLQCEHDKAVCGFQTKDDKPALAQDEAGVVGIRIFCCHWPKPIARWRPRL